MANDNKAKWTEEARAEQSRRIREWAPWRTAGRKPAARVKQGHEALADALAAIGMRKELAEA